MANESTIVSPEMPGVASRQSQMEFQPEPGLSLLDLLLIVARRKQLVCWTTFLGTLVAAGIALLLPTTYSAVAVVMPPQQQQSAVSAFVTQLGPLAAAAGGGLGLKNPADMYIGLLDSRTIGDRLIDKFRLRTVYGVRMLTDARKKLRKRRTFSAAKDSLIKIQVEDTDPNRAAEMANAFVSELNRQNSSFAISDAAQRRIFLEKRLGEEHSALSAAEDAMQATEKRTGIIQVDGQTSVAIGSLAQLQAQITAGEVALERLRMGATAQNPEVLRMETQVAALQTQLRKVEDGSPDRSGDPFLPTSRLPEAGLDYLRCLRDLRYHEFLFELLSKQYEAARIDESEAAPPLHVVDEAVPAERKSGPPRLIIILGGFLLTLGLSSVLVVLQHRFADPSSKEKLRLVRSAIFGTE